MGFLPGNYRSILMKTSNSPQNRNILISHKVPHLFEVVSLFFYFVAALQAEKPSSSHSITDTSCIKDFKWTRKLENSYLVLSKHGELYQGSANGPPKHVMHDIDAGTLYTFI